MSANHARRLNALEEAHRARVLAMTPREWIDRGYLTYRELPAAEEAELIGILRKALADNGEIDRFRLTMDESARALELMATCAPEDGTTAAYARRVRASADRGEVMT